ncbi:MAG: diguanylate cyclase [Treponemataceae bacterium]
MGKVLRRIIDLGVPEDMGAEEAKFIRMSNLGSLLMILVNMPYMILCLRNGWNLVLAELFALNAFLALTLLINGSGRHLLASIYFGALLNFHLIFVTVAMGRDSLLPLLIFFTAGGAITLFGRGKTLLMISTVALIFLGYQAALLLERFFGPIYRLAPGQINELKRYVEYSVFVLIVVNAVIGRFGSISAEDRLRAEQERSERLLALVREQDKQKTLFFQNIAHEIRTPLTLILGSLDDLLQSESNLSSNGERAKLEMMSRNANRLLRLINQLLDLSKIDAGRMRVQAVKGNPTEFVGSIVETFVPYAESRGIALRMKSSGEESDLYFDREIVGKIISNLLSNACKFTQEGGEITVSLENSADGRATAISVKDTGIGIAPEEIDSIFERFHQVDGSVARSSEGTGIGLSLVREIALLHAGEITVSSRLGDGTVFTLTLPKGRTHLAEDEICAALPVDSHECPSYAALETTGLMIAPVARIAECSDLKDLPTILVVDDNADMREYIRGGLSRFYHVVEAVDGLDALTKAAECLPNLIVSDIMMPKMDGLELCRIVRADEKLGNIPIIFLTARASPGFAVTGFEAGAVDYISKPFSLEMLLAKIGSVVRRDAKLEREATHDGLTGLLNRNAWEHETRRDFDRLARYGGKASLAFLDLDDFKTVNDIHGHQTGDEVLISLAQTIMRGLRGSDLAGRYGGEEFVILLSGSSGEIAVQTIERILKEFRAKDVLRNSSSCTFSAGVVEITDTKSAGIADFLSRADTAMYRAKETGKNRVIIWTEEMKMG